eukprot:SAG11_NODE_2653_length_3124_cov_2.301818_4_plen_125_part_00
MPSGFSAARRAGFLNSGVSVSVVYVCPPCPGARSFRERAGEQQFYRPHSEQLTNTMDEEVRALTSKAYSSVRRRAISLLLLLIQISLHMCASIFAKMAKNTNLMDLVTCKLHLSEPPLLVSCRL